MKKKVFCFFCSLYFLLLYLGAATNKLKLEISDSLFWLPQRLTDSFFVCRSSRCKWNMSNQLEILLPSSSFFSLLVPSSSCPCLLLPSPSLLLLHSSSIFLLLPSSSFFPPLLFSSRSVSFLFLPSLILLLPSPSFSFLLLPSSSLIVLLLLPSSSRSKTHVPGPAECA